MSDPEKKKCPHCDKVLPDEPLTEESLASIVGLVRSAEITAEAMDMRPSQAVEAMLRMAMQMQDDEDGAKAFAFLSGKVH